MKPSTSAATSAAATSATEAVFLLPEWAAFGRQSFSADCARALGRADALPQADTGRAAQRLRYVELLPARWSPAALSRHRDAGDATDAAWLRADPAYVRPDINGARLLAYGEALSPTRDETDAMLSALRPLFGDRGFALDAPTPTRWYLRLPAGSQWPDFSEPEAALGEDMFEHLPHGDAARVWRALLNEAQIVLHQHPANEQRRERGLPPINALWVWGGGRLPDRVRIAAARVRSDDDTLRDCAYFAGVPDAGLPMRFADTGTADDAGKSTMPGLYDLHRERDLKRFQDDWLRPAMAALRSSALSSLTLDAADGRRLRLRAAQRWRFWRAPWTPAQ
ncbi:MAG: phosphoglycerate mutase [Lysobacter sp.]|nr:phosphoglycerate mutase [Lysobacter sp.]